MTNFVKRVLISALAAPLLLSQFSGISQGASVDDLASSRPAAAKKVVTTVIPGKIVGRTASLPYKKGWADDSAYGFPSDVGVWTENTVTMAQIEAAARHHGVPWATTDKATDRYNVYQIWGIRPNGNLVLWKYGITKEPLGSYRPSNQISSCRAYMKSTYNDSTPDCTWSWLRKYTSNHMRARRVEATYFLEYKMRKGKCPPGAKACR